MPVMSIEKIGAFTVLSKLGEGAHSSIMRVRRADDGREYALKVINLDTADDNKFLEQAKHEHRVSQMLSHPNLIKVHCFEVEKNWFFQVKKAKLLVEYVNGDTLDNVRMPHRAKLLRVLEKVASGLAHMHHRGVFHADLKPNNIMAGRGGVKVIDYGLAWIKGEPKDRVQGTPEYMAPETARDKVVTEQSDIYNLGATMYRLVTGQLPPSVVQPGMNRKMFEQLFVPVQGHAPQVPKPLCELIERCLAYKPEKRPARATDVEQELQALAAKLVRRPEDQLDAFEW